VVVLDQWYNRLVIHQEDQVEEDQFLVQELHNQSQDQEIHLLLVQHKELMVELVLMVVVMVKVVVVELL
jgi:hypothetical protein